MRNFARLLNSVSSGKLFCFGSDLSGLEFLTDDFVRGETATLLRPAAFSTNPFPVAEVLCPLRPGPIPKPSAPAAFLFEPEAIFNGE
jgi:hypothetical protein